MFLTSEVGREIISERITAVSRNCLASDDAFRFLQSVKGVTMVLSGMSNMEQLEANLATYKEDKPEVVKKFAELKANGTYPINLWD